MIAFIIKQITTAVTVSAPDTRILVYQGADCIAYNSGDVLKSHTVNTLRPMNTPTKAPIMMFKIVFKVFILLSSLIKFKLPVRF